MAKTATINERVYGTAIQINHPADVTVKLELSNRFPHLPAGRPVITVEGDFVAIFSGLTTGIWVSSPVYSREGARVKTSWVRNSLGKPEKIYVTIKEERAPIAGDKQFIVDIGT